MFLKLLLSLLLFGGAGEPHVLSVPSLSLSSAFLFFVWRQDLTKLPRLDSQTFDALAAVSQVAGVSGMCHV